jgi:hypothetical protein
MPIKRRDQDKRNKIMSVALTSNEYDALHEAADTEGRTASNLIQNLIREHTAQYKHKRRNV